MSSYIRSPLSLGQVRAARAAATAALRYLSPPALIPRTSWNQHVLHACSRPAHLCSGDFSATYAAIVRQGPAAHQSVPGAALTSYIQLLEQHIAHGLSILRLFTALPTSPVATCPAASPSPAPASPLVQTAPPSQTTTPTSRPSTIPPPTPPAEPPAPVQPALTTTTPHPTPVSPSRLPPQLSPSPSSDGSHSSRLPAPSSHSTGSVEWVDMDTLDDKLRQQYNRLEDIFSALNDRMRRMEEAMSNGEWTVECTPGAEWVNTDMLDDVMRQHNGHLEDRLSALTGRVNRLQRTVERVESDCLRRIDG